MRVNTARIPAGCGIRERLEIVIDPLSVFRWQLLDTANCRSVYRIKRTEQNQILSGRFSSVAEGGGAFGPCETCPAGCGAGGFWPPQLGSSPIGKRSAEITTPAPLCRRTASARSN